MRRESNKWCWLLLGGMISLFSACSDSWLEAKPDKSLIVPGTIEDFQAMLDNTVQIFNQGQAAGLSEMASGDFYISSASFTSLFGTQERSAYTWAPTQGFYGLESSTDWELAYKRILTANVVLNGIEKIKPDVVQQDDWNRIKGSALFFRSIDFFGLSQEYCKIYNPATAQSELGLPLRLDYDINIKLKRANLRDTYNQLIVDLKSSGRLLGTTSQYKTRPSKQAAFAMLARIYLSMEEYASAGLYADSALQIQSDLIDYAKVNTAATYPISRFNTEVIFHNVFSYGIFSATRLIVDPTLYSSYAMNDYRRTAFFKAVTGGVTFKGNYSGDKNQFGGLATDELYLIRAEVDARKGEVTNALKDLNTLRRKRWQGAYVDLTGTDAGQVLTLVLTERRKELLFRGLRWSDLRRLNLDNRFAVTLTRTLNNVVYSLPPNDKRYVFPIDNQELALTGITQNDR